jgi:metal transporter CNNM
MAADVGCCGTKFWLYIVVIVGLVCFAGLMAGLTLGLMSLGLVDLEVLIKSGRPQHRIHAGNYHLPFLNSFITIITSQITIMLLFFCSQNFPSG